MLLVNFLVMLVKLLVGAAPRWIGCAPASRQRIYFANHTSHIDTLAIWAALPATVRARTRPVAAADYWGKGGLKSYIAKQALNAVLVNRNRSAQTDPLLPLLSALAAGDSLIIFPEGTRRIQRIPGEFKSGLFYLAQRFPEVELVPVYLENFHRVMPKGSVLPVPLLCTVRFGRPINLFENEAKEDFLFRARAAVEELA